MEIGKRIMELRKRLGLTQEELGRSVGVSTQAVSRWENGGAPDVMLLPAIADKLGVSIDALFGREGIQHEAPEEILRTLISHTPKENRLAAAERYAWTLLKAIAAETGDTYEIISNVEDIDRYGKAGFRRYYCVSGMLEGGLVKAAVARDFHYTLMMPAPVHGLASVLRRPEDYLRLFEVLLRPHWLDTLIFAHTQRRIPFSASVAARALKLEKAEMEAMLREMEQYAFFQSNEYATEDGAQRVYSPREGLALIPFLYFAGELMKEQDGGGILMDENREPVLNAWPGEGNPFAEWIAGFPEKRSDSKRDKAALGLFRHAGENTEEERGDETETGNGA